MTFSMKIFNKKIIKELKEAVTGDEIEKILNKYAAQTTNPEDKKNLVRQAMNAIGKSSASTPEDLDLTLRKYYAQNLDPVKNAQKQAGHQAIQQLKAKNVPPPLPNQSAASQPSFDAPTNKMPSLSTLASKEMEPWHQKVGLPDIEPQSQVDEPFKEPPMSKVANTAPKDPTVVPPPSKKPDVPITATGDDDADVPLVSPKDVKAVRKKKSAPRTFTPPSMEPAPVAHQAAEPEVAPTKVTRGRPKVSTSPSKKMPNLSQLAYRKSGKFI
jgi:hypothetical protein